MIEPLPLVSPPSGEWYIVDPESFLRTMVSLSAEYHQISVAVVARVT